MCGIGGYWFPNRGGEQNLIMRLAASLSHRGPDGQGVWVDQEQGIGLAHTRLAIIDPSSAGGQPMATADGRLRIVYNGEVYNYRELRQELERDGVRFRTASDTEVVLYAFERWGPGCLPRLRGMFAFAIWDQLRAELYLVRDRMGVKPLYYSTKNGTIVFGSELKAVMLNPELQREVDDEAVAAYFILGYVPSPLSIWKDVWKVRPGHYVRVGSFGKVEEHPYWAPQFLEKTQLADSSDSEVEEQLLALLLRAFKYRTVSDVPLGVLLSGGIDSSLIAAVLAREAGYRLDTFTMGFAESSHDESTWAQSVARVLGTRHHQFTCSGRDAARLLTSLPVIYDEPIADPSAIPTYLLCRATSEYIKVALSGEGGDELFGGYRTYAHVERLWRGLALVPATGKTLFRMVSRLASSSLFARLCAGVATAGALYRDDPGRLADNARKAAAVFTADALPDAYQQFVSIWSATEVQALLLGYKLSAPPPVLDCPDDVPALEVMSAIDILSYLPDDLLAKSDRAAMAVGLEVREPFLDHEIVAFSRSLPVRYKQRGGVGKYVLRRLLSRYLPEVIVVRPKKGFSPPLAQWLRSDLWRFVTSHLNPQRVKRGGLLSPSSVRDAAEGFARGWVSARKLWTLLVFQLWHDHWVSRDRTG